MFSPFQRRLAAFGVCTFSVIGALNHGIEYSIQAQPEPATAPATSPTASSSTTSVIDPQAQVALKKMGAAYANLRSFSADVKLVGTKGVVPAGAASVRWQKPNRFAVSFFQDGKTVRTVSDGKTMFRTAGSDYFKMPASANTSLKQAIISSGAGGLILPTVDGLVSALQQPTTQSLTLSEGTEPGTQVVTALSKFSPADAEPTQIFIVLGKTDHLMRQIQIRIPSDGKTVVGTEIYSNVRANPVLPASTFVFVPVAGTRLRTAVVQKEPSYFDARLKVGAQPFAFSAKDLSGATVSPAKYKGRVVLLDFWATWCGPCVGELPNVKAAYGKLHAKGFDIVGISLDEDRAALDSFLKAQDVKWPQLFDGKGWGNAIANQYGVKAIPFTVLIGRDGKIAAVNVRGETLEPAVLAALAKK